MAFEEHRASNPAGPFDLNAYGWLVGRVLAVWTAAVPQRMAGRIQARTGDAWIQGSVCSQQCHSEHGFVCCFGPTFLQHGKPLASERPLAERESLELTAERCRGRRTTRPPAPEPGRPPGRAAVKRHDCGFWFPSNYVDTGFLTQRTHNINADASVARLSFAPVGMLRAKSLTSQRPPDSRSAAAHWHG